MQQSHTFLSIALLSRVMDSQHFSNFQPLEDPSPLDAFLREDAAACGVWMVPVSLTPPACPATPQEDMEDIESIPESTLAWLPRRRGERSQGVCIWRVRRE